MFFYNAKNNVIYEARLKNKLYNLYGIYGFNFKLRSVYLCMVVSGELLICMLDLPEVVRLLE